MKTVERRVTAAEIIAETLGTDISDVREGHYQSTRYVRPSVFVVGEALYCAPPRGQKLPRDYEWREFGQSRGRVVWIAEGV